MPPTPANPTEALLSEFCVAIRGFYQMVNNCFHEDKYAGARTQIAKFLALQNYQIWRAFKAHVWSDYDCLISIDNADVSQGAKWRICPLFIFGETPLHELLDPLTVTNRQKIFARLSRVNGLAAQYEMVRQIKDYPVITKILRNTAVQTGRPEDIMKVVMAELLSGESGVEELIAHLEKEWPENIVGYILHKACGLSSEQIKSFKGQCDNTSGSYMTPTALDANRNGTEEEFSCIMAAHGPGRNVHNHAEHKQLRLRSSQSGRLQTATLCPRIVRTA